MITVDLGWTIARIKHVAGKVTTIEIFAPPDGSENGVIQSQYVYLNGDAVSKLMQAIETVKK